MIYTGFPWIWKTGC